MAKEQNKQSKDDEDYSEKEQWKDDLDVLPLNYVKPESKKPIIEKAEFDKKKKKQYEKSHYIPALKCATQMWEKSRRLSSEGNKGGKSLRSICSELNSEMIPEDSDRLVL